MEFFLKYIIYNLLRQVDIKGLLNSQPIHKTLKFIFILLFIFPMLSNIKFIYFNIKDALKSWFHENDRFFYGINWVQIGMVFQRINHTGS